MALISVPNTFSAGAVIVASQHNSNFSTIYSDYNGFIDNTNISASASIAYTKLNLASSIINADVAAGAAIVDTKLAQITTASKVSGTAITGLASLPAGAGVVPAANLGSGTPSASTVLKGDGSWGNGGFVPTNIQVFTASGTWTKPAGVSNVYVKVWGGGGGSTGHSSGGGGGYSEGTTAVTANVTVTVGTGGNSGSNNTPGTAGGTSSFAGTTTIQATGGAINGAGGVGSNGSINLTAEAGAAGAAGVGGAGGDSAFGGRGGNWSTVTTTGKTNGQFPGGGGAGTSGNNGGDAGSQGANGLVIVYY